MNRDTLHQAHTGSYGVEHRDVHNVYGFYHHMATVQGQLLRDSSVRPFVLTRSFFAGSHRHGAVWTGDNAGLWEHLSASVPMLLSLSLCGMSFAGADVPGFFRDPTPEIFSRWHQLGIWYPFYRSHAHMETKRREPWTMGDQITAIVREQITTRYQLMPYWYTLFAGWAAHGTPILRPTWWSDIDDPKAFEHVNEQFFVGDALLVRAITNDAGGPFRTYLPKGEWFDFYDLHAAPRQGGDVVEVEPPDRHVPVFVRKGHMLFKKMRRRRSTGAMAADPYTVEVYGDTVATGRLYVDDGSSHAYESGKFLVQEFRFDGTSLSSNLAGAFGGFGSSRGLPDRQLKHLQVERLVFVGLSRRPSGARVLDERNQTSKVGQFANGTLPVSVEPIEGGGFLAYVKRPSVSLGQAWSVTLSFSTAVS